MSKITNDGLTRSGTGCMAKVGVKGSTLWILSTLTLALSLWPSLTLR